MAVGVMIEAEGVDAPSEQASAVKVMCLACANGDHEIPLVHESCSCRCHGKLGAASEAGFSG